MTTVACKSDKKVGENPFFSAWETPYGVPPFDRILPQHFLPAIERGMSLHDAEIDAIVERVVTASAPEYDFTAPDGFGHKLW